MNEEDYDIFEDDLDIMEIIDYGFPRKIYQRSQHFNTMDNLTFFKRFRLVKASVLELLTIIEHELEYNNDLNNSVPPIDQLLTALRFYASAGHLTTVADFIGMDVSTASRIVSKVTLCIAQLYPRFVNMPSNENIVRTQTDFFHVASFPRVIGCVDGTHVRIQSPGGNDAEIYRNRKGYFSINTQITCDSDLKILDLVARWPGSTHDSTIFNNCRLKERFENNEFPNSILLGDSGYVARNFLLTPLVNPRERNCVERCIGVWKRRFPIIAYGIRVKEQTALQIIIATAVLHNLAKQMHEEEPPNDEDINQEELNYLIEMGNHIDVPHPNGNIAAVPNYLRDHLVNNFFANL